MIRFGFVSSAALTWTDVCLDRFALDRHDRDAPVGNKRSGYVVLRRQRIRSDKQRFSSAGLQRAGEVGCLGRDVSTGDEFTPVNGFSSSKRSRISRRTGISRSAHSIRCLPCGGKVDVFDVVLH